MPSPLGRLSRDLPHCPFAFSHRTAVSLLYHPEQPSRLKACNININLTFPAARVIRCKGGSSGSKRDLGALCALATEVSINDRVREWAPHLPNVTRWDLGSYTMDCELLKALLRVPTLRHVQAPDMNLGQDRSRWQCEWKTLTVGHLQDLEQLLLLPSGVERVVLAEGFDLLDAERQGERVEAVLRRWGPDQLQARVDALPKDEDVKRWRLDAEEAQGGFFGLCLPHAAEVSAHVALLRRAVLPQGGGPRTLALEADWDESSAEHVLQQLAPLLAGTRVRTLCLSFGGAFGRVRGDMLSALPASIASVRMCEASVEEAMEAVSGPAATHALRLVVLLPRGAQDVEELREQCAATQPLVQLEVVHTE